MTNAPRTIYINAGPPNPTRMPNAERREKNGKEDSQSPSLFHARRQENETRRLTVLFRSQQPQRTRDLTAEILPRVCLTLTDLIFTGAKFCLNLNPSFNGSRQGGGSRIPKYAAIKIVIIEHGFEPRYLEY
ncbi:hypothetical protein E3N88_36987 [Mikania micrantha]|uniref:Uncharacterized protein n=1 Tax=Mikania micrantha TaxID=192012 RepID=A0A5N6M5G3_9ASTR|nr:hypothetical protein E3N88_36987 [Mikania micrantha]